MHLARLNIGRLVAPLTEPQLWRSVQALADFVHAGPHRAIMVRRREWFVPMREAFEVLWWYRRTRCRPSPTGWSDWRHLREHGRHRSRSPSAARSRLPAPPRSGATRAVLPDLTGVARVAFCP
jgi:Domain of unknown function (DUF3291)